MNDSTDYENNIYKNSIFKIFEISEADKIILKDALNLISKSITISTKISETPSLSEIFNLIPEINSNENFKCVFTILFAEISRHKGDILLEKLLLEDALNYLFKTLGDYSIVLLPITLSLSNAYKELGLIDDHYAYLNKSFKIAYFNKDFNSLEVIEVLNQFVLFSKYINETIEEGIYSEIIGKIIEKNLQLLDKKSKNLKVENIDNNDNKQKNENEQIKENKENKKIKNKIFVNFKNLPYENKLEILIQISYLLKHVDYMSTYGKIGKNTEKTVKKFNYCNELLENIEILDIDKKTFDFAVIKNDLINENAQKKSYSDEILLKESFIYFYLNPELKNFLSNRVVKNKSDYDNYNKEKEKASSDQINNENNKGILMNFYYLNSLYIIFLH